MILINRFSRWQWFNRSVWYEFTVLCVYSTFLWRQRLGPAAVRCIWSIRRETTVETLVNRYLDGWVEGRLGDGYWVRVLGPPPAGSVPARTPAEKELDAPPDASSLCVKWADDIIGPCSLQDGVDVRGNASRTARMCSRELQRDENDRSRQAKR